MRSSASSPPLHCCTGLAAPKCAMEPQISKACLSLFSACSCWGQASDRLPMGPQTLRKRRMQQSVYLISLIASPRLITARMVAWSSRKWQALSPSSRSNSRTLPVQISRFATGTAWRCRRERRWRWSGRAGVGRARRSSWWNASMIRIPGW